MKSRDEVIVMALELFRSRLAIVERAAKIMQNIFGASLRPRNRSASIAEIDQLSKIISLLEKGKIDVETVACAAVMCEKFIDHDLICAEAGSTSVNCRATAKDWLELCSDLERFQ